MLTTDPNTESYSGHVSVCGQMYHPHDYSILNCHNDSQVDGLGALELLE